jgi:protein-S-isoprenylcysteine O-methyltransferase Ste14
MVTTARRQAWRMLTIEDVRLVACSVPRTTEDLVQGSLASLSMAGTAASRFRRSGTTLEPIHPDRASVLVTSGANAVSRNPMYVGMTGLLLAHAVWRGSWTALLPLVGFVVFIDRAQIQAEEAALLEKFEAAYEAYRATTPRWVDRRSLGLA